MTDHKHLKALIRSRMGRTGESYSIARMRLVTGRPPALTPETVIEAHDRHCMVARFTPDGGSLISGGFGGQARVWSVPGGERLADLTGHDSSVNGVAIGGGRAVTISSDRSVRVWDMDGPPQLRLLGSHRGVVSGVDITPDGGLAATTAHDGRLRLWRVGDGEEPAAIEIGGRPGAVAFHPAEPWVAVAAGDRVRVLTREGATVADLASAGAGSTAVRWSPSGDAVVASTVEGAVRVWSVADWAAVRDVALPGGGWVPVALSPDGALMAVGWDHHVGLWSAAAAEPLAVLDGLPKGIYSLDFSPGGDRLALGAADGRVRMWAVG